MKRILLASASIVAFAGAAAADVTFSGDAEFGYNDTDNPDSAADDKGFYYSFGLGVAGSMELDNGLTAAMSGDVTIGGADTFDSNNVAVDDLKVSLSSDTASLTFGDTAPAADAMWSGVGNMEADGFNDEDDLANEDGQLVGMMEFGGTKVGISTAVVDGDMKGMQLGVTGSAGSVSYGVAYQDDEWTGNDILGLRVGMSLGGADVALGYADNGTRDSTAVSVSYPVGDVTVGAFYSMESAGDDNYGLSVAYASGPLSVDALFHDGQDEDMQLNVKYDMGNGLTLAGGYRAEGSNQADIAYVSASYDLGGGATALFSYVDVSRGSAGTATAAGEFGPGEDLREGMTVEVSFAF